MANDTKDWFVGERSEALASLLLCLSKRHPDSR